MNPIQLYNKVKEIREKSDESIAEICIRLKEKPWKYYRGMDLVLGDKKPKRKSQKTAQIIMPSNQGSTKCVLIMGTPEQIREVLG